MPKRPRVLETACQLLSEARKAAHAAAKLPCPPEEKPRQFPLLPVAVNETEYLLFKLGDPTWDSKSAANRLAWTLGLQDKDEKSVEEEFHKVLQTYRRHAAAAGRGQPILNTDLRVLLPVYVKRGNMVLRDEFDFHIGSLGSSGITMAAALQQYASDVCVDLGLNSQWFGAIMRGMGTIVSYVSEEIKTTGTSEFVIPGGAGALRTKPHDLPVVEEVNPERDAAEKERSRRFQERVALKQRLKEAAAVATQLPPPVSATPGVVKSEGAQGAGVLQGRPVGTPAGQPMKVEQGQDSQQPVQGQQMPGATGVGHTGGMHANPQALIQQQFQAQQQLQQHQQHFQQQQQQRW